MKHLRHQVKQGRHQVEHEKPGTRLPSVFTALSQAVLYDVETDGGTVHQQDRGETWLDIVKAPNWSSNLMETSPFLVESCRFAGIFSVQDWWNVWISGLSFCLFVSLILKVDFNPHCLSEVASLTNV